MNKLIAVLFIALLVGCSTTPEKEYVYQNVYISPELPILRAIERPLLFSVNIDVNDSDEATLKIDQLRLLYMNERNLIEAIKFYEKQIEIYKEFRDKFNTR